MFRASIAHLQEDTLVYMQQMVLPLSTGVRGALSVHSLNCAPIGHHELLLSYAACIQLCPPEDEHLRLETCTGQ